MNIGKYSTILVSVLLAGILIGTVGIPIIDGIANDTNTVSNSGAQWVRMAYVTDDSDYSFTVHMNDNDTVTITNGDDVQTGPADDIILYADELHTVFIKDGVLCTLGENSVGDISGGPIDEGYDLTVKRVSGAVSMTARFGASWGSPTWAYVPISGANYASFGADAVPLHKTSSELAVNGGFAGVYANHVGVWDVAYDFGLVIDADVTADYINSVQWVQESELADELEVPFNPDDIIPLNPGDIINPYEPGIIDPLGPIEIDPIDINPNQNAIMSVPTPTYTDGDWGYDLFTMDNTSYARIVSYSGAGGGTVTIPTTVGGYDVRALGKGGNYEGIFSNTTSATNLVIPDFTYLYQIDAYAFYQCGFTGTLTILESTIVDVGNYAFAESKFTGSVTLPSYKYTQANGVFNNCKGITSVDVQGSISQYCFRGCTSLQSVTFTNPSALIGDYAFEGCTALSGNLTIPNDFRSLGESCFRNCSSLTGTLTLPTNSLFTTINRNSFDGCKFTGALNIPASVKSIDTNAFKGCNFTSLTLPEGLTTIKGYAFAECKYIEGNLTIPNTVTSLGSQSFYYCQSITSLTIGTGLTSIPSQCFDKCSGLRGAFFIPDNITTIANYAFRDTGFDDKIILSSHITTIGDSAFKGCDAPYIVSMMSDTATISNTAFDSMENISEILSLGSAVIEGGSYGLPLDVEVQDHIDADNYLAVVSYSETVQKTGAVYDIVNLLPIVMTAGLLIACVWYFTRK